jgi:hypothetical protein
MNEAIKLAIEKGGYEISDQKYAKLMSFPNVLDPLFWQALGKALGWDDFRAAVPPLWLANALHYHELLLTGGDTEKFWKELIK